MRLSVVATLYRSAPYLRDFHRRVSVAARRFAGDDYEIVLVNDGSPDDSLAVALDLQAADGRLRIVDLSRNFGHHQAMWTGSSTPAANGSTCSIATWKKARMARTAGCQAARNCGGRRLRGPARAGRLVVESLRGLDVLPCLQRLSTVSIPHNLMTIRLMSRRFYRRLARAHRIDLCHCPACGHARDSRNSRSNCPKAESRRPPTVSWRQVKLLVNSVTSFSEMPLYLVFYLGVALLASSSLVAGC